VKAKTLIGLTAMLAALAVLLVGDWSSSRAEPVASITLPPPGATKQLYPGCNNVGATFRDGTSSSAVIEAVDPPSSVKTMWHHDAARQRWEAFSPATPEASDLPTVNFLDAIWLCLVGRSPTPTPTATAPSAPAGQSATPTSAATTPTAPAGQTATPTPASPASATVSRAVPPTDVLTSFRYSMKMSVEADAEMAFSIGSSGKFKAPDRTSCAVTGSVGGMTSDMGKVVVIGNDAWVDVGLGWTHTQANDPSAVENLELCPGSSLFWESLQLPADLGGIQGQPVTINGVAAVRLSLAGLAQSLPSLGIIPLGLEGATIHRFDIWVAQDGGWLVALALDASVYGELVGDSGGVSGAAIRVRVDVTNPNDASIRVDPPTS